jgi:hypothetical protein
MAKLFKILNADFAVVPATFTVNAAVAQVAASSPGILGMDYTVPNANRWFEAGDNVVLTGISVNLPYSFGQGTGNAFINVSWRDSLGNSITIPELSGSGNMFLPGLCGMLELPPEGIFIEAPVAVGRVKLVLEAVTANISMLNVPAILDGTVQNIGSSLRLFHTRALSAVP